MAHNNDEFSDEAVQSWGTARISHRTEPFEYLSSKAELLPGGKVENLVPIYDYKMPKNGGKGIVIYIVEISVLLGVKLPQDGDIGMKHEIKNDQKYYSGKQYKKDYGVEKLGSGFLDIEEERLEVIWPAYRMKNKMRCLDFTTLSGAREHPRTLHGNMVANLAGGKKYGVAPNATIVIVNKIPVDFSGDTEYASGIGASYEAILSHYDSLPKGTRAIVNVSQGTIGHFGTPWSITSYHLISKLTQKEICFVSAAGNRGDKLDTDKTDWKGCGEVLKGYQTWVEDLESRNELTKQAIKTKLEEIQSKIDESDAKIPAVHPAVISIGGFNTEDEICREYYHGRAIDIYAPAKNAPWMDENGNTWDTFYESAALKKESGTSYATPLMSGAIACLLSQDPDLKPAEMKTKLKAMSRPLRGGEPSLCIAKVK